MKKKTLQGLRKKILLSLMLTSLCIASGCGLADNGQTTTPGTTGDMVENEGTRDNNSVLDKGGANGTDNISIMDELTGNETEDPYYNTSQPFDSEDEPTFRDDADHMMDDIGDAINNIGDGIEDGVDALTSPNPTGTTNNNSNIGTNTTR